MKCFISRIRVSYFEPEYFTVLWYGKDGEQNLTRNSPKRYSSDPIIQWRPINIPNPTELELWKIIEIDVPIESLLTCNDSIIRTYAKERWKHETSSNGNIKSVGVDRRC